MKIKSIFTFIVFVLSFGIHLFAQQNTNPKKDYLISIHTSYGDIQMILFDATPKHKENFIKLAQRGFYNGTTFHRVINEFMIQGGDSLSQDEDKNNDGMGDIGYTIPAEFVDTLTHNRGVVAAARTNNPAKASSGSQFYIVQAKNGTHFLDKNYTVFGKVITGMDVVDAISVAPKDNRDRPLTDIRMTVTAKLVKKKVIYKIIAEQKSKGAAW